MKEKDRNGLNILVFSYAVLWCTIVVLPVYYYNVLMYYYAVILCYSVIIRNQLISRVITMNN